MLGECLSVAVCLLGGLLCLARCYEITRGLVKAVTNARPDPKWLVEGTGAGGDVKALVPVADFAHWLLYSRLECTQGALWFLSAAWSPLYHEFCVYNDWAPAWIFYILGVANVAALAYLLVVVQRHLAKRKGRPNGVAVST